VTTSESFRTNPLEPVKAYLGYSFLVNWLMTTIDPQGWHATGEKPIVRVANDPVEISCRLLQRLKRTTDALKVRTILVEELVAGDITPGDSPPPNIRLVEDCARSMGYELVETFDEMRAEYKRDPNELKKHYALTNDVMGHLSIFGNHFLASRVAALLAAAPAEGHADDYKPEALSPGQGVNLIPSSEGLETWIPVNPLADLRRMESRSNDPRPFKMAATGKNDIHFLQSSPLELAAGPYTLSLDVRPEAIAMLRIYLLDASNTGFYCDFDFAPTVAVCSRLGPTPKLNGGIEPVRDGWYRVWLGGALSANTLRIQLQITDAKGEWSFLPDGEALSLRGVQVERGHTPTAYKPTFGQSASGSAAR
jgi:hypothetical protein